MIEVRRASFTYPGCAEPALRQVSLRLEAGEMVALVGPAGSGKSTLLYLLAGLAPGTVAGRLEGEVLLQGQAPARASRAWRATHVGIVFSDPLVQLSGSCYSVREEVAWGLENLAVPRPEMERRVQRALDLLELGPLAERSPYALSSGQQQRVALASVLAMEPPLLLLDEPASTLDPQGAASLGEAARAAAAAGHTVVWATPSLDQAALCPRWLALQEGRLVYDGPADPEKAPGCRPAPWTLLARQAVRRGLWSGPLPVTEEEALDTLARGKPGD
ncbi:MAG TPA: ABC transporter ATP-binding protein [Candidatus Nitrosotenuis sp.]|nr:ABC transporter ATP-binding protein [Candidatus Nitrosotenuis sp.]